MKKKLKGLLSLWLAVIMVFGLMVTPAMAADEKVYVITVKDGNSVTTIDVGLELNKALNAQSEITEIAYANKQEGGFVLDGWKLWKGNLSGGVVSSVEDETPETNDAAFVITQNTYNEYANGTDKALTIGPVWLEKYKIDPQPTNEKPVVGAQVKTGDGWNWVYDVDPEVEVKYQWYEFVSDGPNIIVDGQTTNTLTKGTNGPQYVCQVTFDPAGDNVTLTSDPITITTVGVSFDANGGTGTMDSDTAVKGAYYPLPANGFVAPQYNTFAGWSTSASGDVITADAIYDYDDEITLYAIWEDIPANTGVYIGPEELHVNTYYNFSNAGLSPEGSEASYNVYLTYTNGTDATGGYTLTINNLNYSREGVEASAISSLSKDLTLVLIGENIATGWGDAAYSGSSYGIAVNANLTIKGTGKLTANGGAGMNSYGIGVAGDLTIESSGIVNANGGAGMNSYGIGVTRNLTIESGDITANGGAATGGSSFGIAAHGTVTISGGTINANGGTATDGSSFGLASDGALSITGGTVTVKGGEASASVSLMRAAFRMVRSYGPIIGNNSFGMASNDNITITGGTVNATGGSAGDGNYSGGVGANGTISINNALVNISGDGWALGASGGVNIEPGNKDVYTDDTKVSDVNGIDWDNVKLFEMRAASDSGDGGSSGGYRPASHGCSSKCNICGGCKDLNCGYNTCKDKCILLTMDFDDVSEADWFHEAVGYVYHRGIMDGVSDSKFAPYGTTTRAMIVTTIWRMEGSPVVNYLMTFKDVAPDQWYTEAIRWAASEGIVEGYSDTAFGPTDDITREQMVTILWRYAKHEGIDVSAGEDTNILSYEDAFDIKEYAVPAMQWACAEGIISGRISGLLEPAAPSMRCEIAQMLMNFCELG